jgi:transposase
VSEQIRQFPEFISLNDTTYAWECSVAGRRRYILCFNPQLFQDQRQAQARTLAEFRHFVEQMNTELRQAKRSRQRQTSYDKFTRRLKKLKLHRFVDVALDEIQLLPDTERDPIRTYQARAIIDPPAQRQAEKLHGFWLLVTNHTETIGQSYQLTTEQTVEPYREKVVIESAFRDIKSFVDIKPVHVWTPAHVKAHYTCCVLAHLINRTLSVRLHLNPGSVSEDIISHERLYQELSDCQIDHIEVQNLSLSTYRRTRESPRQKELLQRLGLQQLLAFEGASPMN